MKKKNVAIWANGLAALTALSLLVGCGQTHDAGSDVKVTNGLQVKETEFPSVILLVSFTADGESLCTGTFVNDSQVVTAGHCVESLNAKNPAMFYVTFDDNGQPRPVAKASAFARHSDYDIRRGVGPLDLAVLDFPAHTAPAISTIAPVAPSADEELIIVGYGNNENYVNEGGALDGSGSGVKRAGVNKIASVANGMIAFIGVPGGIDDLEEGQLVSSGSGDSGGPMFVNGQLVGVTSGGGFARTADGASLVTVSYYVDLNSEKSRSLLAATLKKPQTAAPAATR